MIGGNASWELHKPKDFDFQFTQNFSNDLGIIANLINARKKTGGFVKERVDHLRETDLIIPNETVRSTKRMRAINHETDVHIFRRLRIVVFHNCQDTVNLPMCGTAITDDDFNLIQFRTVERDGLKRSGRHILQVILQQMSQP